jgi:IclR family mhp operon transcriptional activator
MSARLPEPTIAPKPRAAGPARQPADDIVSLRHGLAALRLAGVSPELSSGSLAAACGISRAAGYRVLQTLVEEGYLDRSGGGNRVRYRPRQRVRELAAGYRGSVLVLDVAMPLMLEWTCEHGRPLALSTPDGEYSVVRFTTDPAAARALVRYRAGARMSALMSASAMLCLAYQPPGIQARAIARLPRSPLPAYAERRSAPEIASILERVRRAGHAVFRPVGLREATLALPLWLDGELCACVALRYMLVADGGSAGHAARLRLLGTLCDRITAESHRRAGARGAAGTS